MRSQLACLRLLIATAIVLQACGGSTEHVDIGPTGGGGGTGGGSGGATGTGAKEGASGAHTGGAVGGVISETGGSGWSEGGSGSPGTGAGSPGTGAGYPETGGASYGRGGAQGEGASTGSGGGNGGTGGFPPGKTHPGAGGSPAGSPGAGGLPVWPDPYVDAGSSTVTIVGAWDGYTENGIPPWDNNIRLVITSASEGGGVQGTMTVGTGDPPPPATDPNTGYPPSYTFDSYKSILPQGVYPGFTYTLLKGTVKDARVRFTIAMDELWRQWCALQTPVYSSGRYACMAATGFSSGPDGCAYTDPETMQSVSANCGKLDLCIAENVCTCDATSCTASQTQNTFTCDLRFEVAQAYGSCTAGAVTGSTTRLTRAE